MDYFEKLKQLPCEVVKESGRLTGNYALRISISGGIWFLEYVYDGELFSGYEEAVYPFRCSGNNLEEIIDKAFSFFDNNFGNSDWFKKTHVGISIGEQPLEEDVVGMGELGKVWNEQAIISRLDRIIELLERPIIMPFSLPIQPLQPIYYDTNKVYCSTASTGGGEK